MSSNSSSGSTGSGAATLLGVLFVGLKLTGYINWPWVWVLAPFWIPLAIVVGLLLLAGLATILAELLKK